MHIAFYIVVISVVAFSLAQAIYDFSIGTCYRHELISLHVFKLACCVFLVLVIVAEYNEDRRRRHADEKIDVIT